MNYLNPAVINQSQINLFQYIKSVVSAKISFVDEIVDVLKISNDNAYRRIRGEKELLLKRYKS